MLPWMEVNGDSVTIMPLHYRCITSPPPQKDTWGRPSSYLMCFTAPWMHVSVQSQSGAAECYLSCCRARGRYFYLCSLSGATAGWRDGENWEPSNASDRLMRALNAEPRGEWGGQTRKSEIPDASFPFVFFLPAPSPCVVQSLNATRDLVILMQVSVLRFMAVCEMCRQRKRKNGGT